VGSAGRGAIDMAPIIEINWTSIFTMLGLLALAAGFVLLVVKGIFWYLKNQRTHND
jgi:hypothetical protein